MAISLVKPKALFAQIIVIASKFVENHDILINELVDRNKGVYSFRNTIYPMIFDNRPGFYLLKVKNTRGLYLHISVTLKAPKDTPSLESNFAFEGISVQFFHGTGRLFCRAEWDVKRKKDRLEHPQPHWHWAGEQICEENKGSDTVEESGNEIASFTEEIANTGNTPELPSVDFKELHYAMAAKWASQGDAVEEFTPQRLYEWLTRCVANVIDQYNYQVNKDTFVSAMDW